VLNAIKAQDEMAPRGASVIRAKREPLYVSFDDYETVDLCWKRMVPTPKGEDRART
jgi:hypothetical protein